MTEHELTNFERAVIKAIAKRERERILRRRRFRAAAAGVVAASVLSVIFLLT